MGRHAGFEGRHPASPLLRFGVHGGTRRATAHGAAEFVVVADAVAAGADLASAGDEIPRLREVRCLLDSFRIELAHGEGKVLDGEQVGHAELRRFAKMPSEGSFFLGSKYTEKSPSSAKGMENGRKMKLGLKVRT